MLYLASFLRESGAEIKLLDLSGSKFNEKYVLPESDIYGIGFVSPQAIYAKEILNKINKEKPNFPIIAGGVHSTSIPEHSLSLGFDAVIKGEGEKSTLQILKEGIKKKVYDLDFISSLDDLPSPAWDLIDMESYISDLGVVGYMKNNQNFQREINVMGTRGCTGKCAYCTEYKGPLRWRSTEKIIKELNVLREKYNVNRFFFVDDNLVINKRWLGGLTKKLKEEEIKWHCLGRADQVDYKICKEMVDSGCMGIDFGIESGSQKILNIIKKDTTVQRQEEGIKSAYEAGLRVRAQFMVGLPQEEEEDHKKNLEFIEKNINYVSKWGIHIFVPFPSCEIWRKPESFDYYINKNTDFSNFQTIGKPGEWNFVPVEKQEIIARRREEILNKINEKNIFKTV